MKKVVSKANGVIASQFKSNAVPHIDDLATALVACNSIGFTFMLSIGISLYRTITLALQFIVAISTYFCRFAVEYFIRKNSWYLLPLYALPSEKPFQCSGAHRSLNTLLTTSSSSLVLFIDSWF